MPGNETIKIFVDAHVFDQEYQGSRTFIKELYTALSVRKDIQLLMAAYDIDRLKNEFPLAGNIEFIRYKTRSGWSRLLFSIHKILKEHKVDFAHFQYMLPPFKTKNIPFIVTIHDVIFKENPGDFSRSYRLSKKILYQMAAERAEIITTVSAFSQRSIEKFLQIPAEKTTVIPNGVSALFFTSYNQTTARAFTKSQWGFENYILYVSRFEPRKNHLALLNAWLELDLHQAGYHLVFAGHESLPVPALTKKLKSLPKQVKDKVILLHNIHDNHLANLYRGASLFVYPSGAEGFGIPPLEAAAMKVPVICSNQSAMQDFTFFGANHINPSDHEKLKERISETLHSPPDMEELEQIATAVRTRYSWEKSADCFYNLLKQYNASITQKKRKHDQLFVS